MINRNMLTGWIYKMEIEILDDSKVSGSMMEPVTMTAAQRKSKF